MSKLGRNRKGKMAATPLGALAFGADAQGESFTFLVHANEQLSSVNVKVLDSEEGEFIDFVANNKKLLDF